MINLIKAQIVHPELLVKINLTCKVSQIQFICRFQFVIAVKIFQAAISPTNS
jgi:hypothetical protein